MRTRNRAALLNLVREHGRITRPELARLTGLTPTAVSDLTRRMLAEGLLRRAGTGASIGGRRPEILSLNPKAGYAVGFDLEESLTIAILDFSLQLVHCEREPLGPDRAPADVYPRMQALLRRALQRLGLAKNGLIGVGVSVPGLVEAGVAVFLPHFPWREAHVGNELSALLGLPVLLENEARATALAEQWLGGGRRAADFVCFNVKTGIGAGIVTNRELYRGIGGSAGEVGHTTIVINGPLCGCGNRGCLEAVASTKGLLERAAARLGEEIDLPALAARARTGDGVCLDLLRENGRYLGIGLANLINLLNPEMILLERDLLLYADLIDGELAEVIAAKALARPRSQVRILASTLGEEAPALGAAILPLQKVFAAGGLQRA